MTAVEFIVDELNKEMGLISFVTGTEESYKSAIFSIIERAKEMEKEQKQTSIENQVNILKDTLDEMMTGFESEEDRMDFILDICNGYKKRTKSQ